MFPGSPRYLVPFHPKRLPHSFTDVLIIGGGLAGLRAAIAVPPHLTSLVITKDAIEQSNSNFAQGGIAGVIDPEDRFEEHVTDTLVAGGTATSKSSKWSFAKLRAVFTSSVNGGPASTNPMANSYLAGKEDTAAIESCMHSGMLRARKSCGPSLTG
jgi:aspartate oxidase